MKLSVMLFPYHRGLVDGQWTPSQLVEAFAKAGISGIEPMQNAHWQDEGKWRAFDDAVKAAGMVYTCYDVIVDLVGETPAHREKAIRTAVDGIAHARDVLACPTVLLAGSRPAPGMGEAEGRRIYAESLARIIDEAGDCGVTVTIEDFGVYPKFTAAAAHCREVIEAVNRPQMRFTFDNGNFLLGGDEPMAVFDALYPYTAHVHIKDFARREPDGNPSLTSPDGKPYKGCMIGEGVARVRECVSRLRQIGYGGWISLEVGSGDVVLQAQKGAQVVAEAWDNA